MTRPGANQSQRCRYNTRRLAGQSLECHFFRPGKIPKEKTGIKHRVCRSRADALTTRPARLSTGQAREGPSLFCIITVRRMKRQKKGEPGLHSTQGTSRQTYPNLKKKKTNKQKQKNTTSASSGAELGSIPASSPWILFPGRVKPVT